MVRTTGVVVLAIALAMACGLGPEGPQGPPGPKGDQGDPGDDGASGGGFVVVANDTPTDHAVQTTDGNLVIGTVSLSGRAGMPSTATAVLVMLTPCINIGAGTPLVLSVGLPTISPTTPRYYVQDNCNPAFGFRESWQLWIPVDSTQQVELGVRPYSLADMSAYVSVRLRLMGWIE